MPPRRVPFSKVTVQPAPGFRTPDRVNPTTGRVDTIPDSAVNADVFASPTPADNAEIKEQQDISERQRELKHALEAAKNGGRRRKSRKTRRGRKSRRRSTRRS
jgi:hypothetical protein